ncbi:MAG: hypothetical protein HYZ28_07460 [Myxococcales bacterium]|nr:hypothetical protein [Myxococcales bacterium]
MREIYIVATGQPEPITLEKLAEAYESEEAQLATGEGGLFFTVVAEQARVEVRFDRREAGLGWAPELITGSDETRAALKAARGFYRISFEPAKPQPSVAVFEALWCARAILEQAQGVLLDVSAFKLHGMEDVVEITELDFDIRDHLNLHAVEATETDTPLWVHSHGMAKFGSRDVEVFHLGEADLGAAETFLHELCTDLAFGQGPQLRAPVQTSAGASFTLLPSEEGRLNLFGISSDTFDGHEGLYVTVVSADGRHSVAELLRPYRERFESETAEEAHELKEQASFLLPSFKARFQRRGFMEPLTFLVRAPFEAHPKGETVTENLWAEVLSWDEETLVAKLVDGGESTTEWRKGAQVEISEDQINAIALGREGRTLEDDEMRALLLAEKPM